MILTYVLLGVALLLCLFVISGARHADRHSHNDRV